MIDISALPPGRYVVAVSGGIDSIVLLHALARQKDISLVVAHVDHGIRPDSAQDAEFVSNLASEYGLRCSVYHANLGPETSEEQARSSRYEFLSQCMVESDAQAIVMAHHQDDVLETIILNFIRGTSWRGLCSLRTHEQLLRPLLRCSKDQIRQHAQQFGLQWREDSTNSNDVYLRNFIRHNYMPKLDEPRRSSLMQLYESQIELVSTIDAELKAWVEATSMREESQIRIPRYFIIMMGDRVAREVLQYVIHRIAGHGLDQAGVSALLHFVKSAHVGKTFIPSKDVHCIVDKHSLIVRPPVI